MFPEWINKIIRRRIRSIAGTLQNKTPDDLRVLADQIRKKVPGSAVLIFSISAEAEKINFVLVLAETFRSTNLNAKEMALEISLLIDGSAGGRADFAQGGGRNKEGILKAIQKFKQQIAQHKDKPCK